MVKSNEFLVETERLRRENEALRQQLTEAKAATNAIKKGGIDAVVFTGENDLKIYTQSTADKIYRVLVEKMNEGAVTVDREGTILYCNSCFATMVNRPLEKLTGTGFKKFVAKTVQKRINDFLNWSGQTELKEEIFLHAAAGGRLPVLLTATTFHVDTIFVLSIILTNLTIQKKDKDELKLRTKQLRQKNKELFRESEEKEARAAELSLANKELESFTYVSSHDLQEPLRKIQTFAARILEKEYAVLSDTGKNYLQRMEKAALRMQTLIEDLLAYSQTKTGERKFGTINLNIIIAEVVEELTDAIRDKAAVLDLDGMCDIPVIRFQFWQVAYNIISNALKFSKPGVPPRIKISSSQGRGHQFATEGLLPDKLYCHMRFSDNGIGFDPQYKDKIFQVFQRLHGKEEYAGTGIGLAIVKKIIENHNGIITASSELGKGATFDIYIPG